MQINRNQKVLAGELKPGDRFYKFNDKTKKVWEVDSVRFSYLNVVDPSILLKYRSLNSSKVNRNTPVIFLRSKTENF